MAAAIVLGVRQTGKSTLARRLLAGERTYRTLDDLEVLAAAGEHPVDLLGLPVELTLDEVQRAPEFLLAVKRVSMKSECQGDSC